MKRIAALLAALTVAAGSLTGTAAAADDLARFHGQEVAWKSCGDPALDAAGVRCATVTVPLDYARPQGRTTTVAISRLKAADPARRRGIMLANPGGPGGSGLFATLHFKQAMTPEVVATYDLIGMDPRGVGRSERIDCGWPVGHMLWSSGVDREGFDRAVRTQADLARRCADKEGDRIAHFTTRNTARDMDVIRAALGEERISYFGMSYGTYLGAVFTQLFPHRSDRIVLDSAIDPDRYMAETIRTQGPENEAALDDWAAWTSERHAEYRLGRTRKQVRARVERLIEQAAKTPIRIGGYLLDEHFLPILLFTQLTDARRDAALAARVRQLADAAEGKQVVPSPELEAELSFMLKGKPEEWSVQAAVICGDAAVPRDPEVYWRAMRRSKASQPVFGGYANGITACAFWPKPVEPRTVVRNDVPALIVQTTHDTRTAYAEGKALRRAMSASRLVTLKDVRMHGVFGLLPNACVQKAVNTYFADGTLPAADLTCRAD
ncbi:alpha/beta hydrolase [Nonomuraea longicatena]|uniref:Alpha/beta hydrolase n=1 Tax=Nonomuraea longicatena TaxID=83682 RepID=A0ABN1Q2Q5_9ACTN